MTPPAAERHYRLAADAVSWCLPRAFAPLAGIVESYDSPRGLGWIQPEDNQALRIPFQCTTLVDGTREIADMTPVVFRLEPRGVGHWEAVAVVSR